MNAQDVGKVTAKSDSTQRPEIGDEEIDAHRAMVIWLFLVTVLTCSILAILLWRSDPTLSHGNGAPILLIVVFAGALGGFVSRLRRLYVFEDIFPRKNFTILLKRINWYLIAYSSIPPLVGAIAAAAVYVIFAGEMIKGPLFPTFDCSLDKKDCSTLSEFLGYWSPKEATDYAKCIVWGFISGFSERFIDDILNRFGAKEKPKESGLNEKII